jgi:molybdopterin converting factor small subunit
MVRRVQIRYYAQLRDSLGKGSEEVELDLPAGEREVLERLAALHPRQRDILLASRVASEDGYVGGRVPAEAPSGLDIISPISGG